jgi:hypothetical protein
MKKNQGKKKQLRVVNFIIPSTNYLGYKCKWVLVAKFKKRDSNLMIMGGGSTLS